MIDSKLIRFNCIYEIIKTIDALIFTISLTVKELKIYELFL